MKLKVLMATILYVTSFGTSATPASAAKMYYFYSNTFNVKITPVTTALVSSGGSIGLGRYPYIDPAAQNRKLNGEFSLSFGGYYDTDDVIDQDDGQRVKSTLTSIESDKFGSIYSSETMWIEKSSTGSLFFGFSNPSFNIGSGRTQKVFDATSISGKSFGIDATKTDSSLLVDGIYATYNQTITNLYGVQGRDRIQELGEYATRSYILAGANAANGRTSSSGAGIVIPDGGQFQLFAELPGHSGGGGGSTGGIDPIPALPNPSTWIMMVLGFGIIGNSIRYRYRSLATVATETLVVITHKQGLQWALWPPYRSSLAAPADLHC